MCLNGKLANSRHFKPILAGWRPQKAFYGRILLLRALQLAWHYLRENEIVLVEKMDGLTQKTFWAVMDFYLTLLTNYAP